MLAAKRVVITWIIDHAFRGQGPDPSRKSADQILVVRCDDAGALKRGESLTERADALEVQVIGWLV